MPHPPESPLPLARSAPPARDGVSPSSIVTPSQNFGHWPTLLAFLTARFPHVDAAVWHKRLQENGIEDAANAPFQAGQRIYYFREVEHEARIPFEATILWQNEHLLVADKPHFLPVIPSGKYVQETLLVRLKKALHLETLAPIHRIDRDTAGLVLFSKQVATRGLYQQLFRERAVEKSYECIAPWNPAISFPLTRHTRITADRHFMQQTETEGEPNALTTIALLGVRGNLARYRLQPVTGQRHQLRVHMNALGLPMVNDGIYPTLTPEGSADYARPLQLLAKTLAFTDPLTGEWLHFESGRILQMWSHIGLDATM